jgi:hypothetical protein
VFLCSTQVKSTQRMTFSDGAYSAKQTVKLFHILFVHVGVSSNHLSGVFQVPHLYYSKEC